MSGERRTLALRELGVVPYAEGLELQADLVRKRRAADIPDTLLLLEHPHVVTLGSSSDPAHVLTDQSERDRLGVELFKSGRGGDVTYHGPGQLVVYVLLDLRRLGVGIRKLVSTLEQTVINLMEQENIVAARRVDAPGVYVDGRKLAALGLRVRRGCTYHGLSLNVDMDLAPFSRINPCGYPDLKVTQLRDLGLAGDADEWGERFVGEFANLLQNSS